jgi:hypothetical protein
MTPGTVMEIGRQAIEVTLLIAAPTLDYGASRWPDCQHLSSSHSD